MIRMREARKNSVVLFALKTEKKISMFRETTPEKVFLEPKFSETHGETIFLAMCSSALFYVALSSFGKISRRRIHDSFLAFRKIMINILRKLRDYLHEKACPIYRKTVLKNVVYWNVYQVRYLFMLKGVTFNCLPLEWFSGRLYNHISFTLGNS